MKLRTTHYLLATVLLSASLTACKRKISTDPPLTNTTTATTKQLFDDAFNSMIQTTTFDASNSNFTFTSARGAKVTINGTCLRNNGNAVSGQVTLEFFEAYNKVDMATANKPTMGFISPGVYQMLETGGQFYVNVKQNNTALATTCPVQVSLPATETSGIDPEMTGFRGNINAETGLVWTRDTTVNVKSNTQFNWYELSIPNFGWYNCDKYWNDPRPKTLIGTTLPAGMATDAIVMVIEKAGIRGLGYSFGQYPVGMDCYIIAVGSKDDKYQWIINNTTLTTGHNETFNIANARIGTKEEYKQAILALP